MATVNSRQQAPAQQRAERGIIASLIFRLGQFIGFILLTLLFSIIIEWVGIATHLWHEPGAKHSEAMLEKELTYLNNDFRQSAIVDQPIKFAQETGTFFFVYLFEKTGIKTALLWLATPTHPQKSSKTRQKLHRAYQQVSEYIKASVIVVQIFGVRLAVLVLAMPAFLLLSFTGLVDGLVQRDVRRWSAGRESSFVYHWAKTILYPSLILPWIIYLALPVSIHPNAIVLPFAVLFAVSVTVMASMFKKYL